MTDFKLDTSGIVLLPRPGAEDRFQDGWRFIDLDPFTQGYIERVIRELLDNGGADEARRQGIDFAALLRFDRVAPETLARIMEDCAAIKRRFPKSDDVGGGKNAWLLRQRGEFDAPPPFCAIYMPPLTVYLGDDGKVRF